MTATTPSGRLLHPVVSRPLQARFLTIPQTPLCYWLRERFFELLAGKTLGEVADVATGLQTSNDPRFVRYVWEVSPREWGRPLRARRWVPFEKGGGYGKWFGHHFWAVDWEREGARINATPGPRVQNEQHYFKAGWTYSSLAMGAVGARQLDGSLWGAVLADAVFARQQGCIGILLNARVASTATRSIRTSMVLSASYVGRVPVPAILPSSLTKSERTCIALKRHLVALDPTERSFGRLPVSGASLTDAWRALTNDSEAVAAVLHTLEGLSERAVFAAYGITGDDLQAVLDETGTPAGWFPLIAGYDAIPVLPPGLEMPAELLPALAREPRRTLSAEDLATLQHRLRALHEAGPGATVEADEPADAEDADDQEPDVAAAGARIPIPTETFLEELSQKLEVHPLSVYWLLRKLRKEESVLCLLELRRFAEDYLSVTVLSLLGHRWPREFETGPLPSLADAGGVTPLAEGTPGPTLLASVRGQLAADFGQAHAGAIEREFEKLTGSSLGVWLQASFFKRHVTQFRKRPIAWQLESAPPAGARRKGRAATRRLPAFSGLLYYHRLDADLLPRLRTHVVGSLRTSLQTELGGLEKVESRSADQDARRIELQEKLDELKSFDGRLEELIAQGFKSPALDEVGAKEALDPFTSRDGQAPAPASRDAFLAQERRYAPDPNDGVRVNLAPLQKAGLLAAEVLAAKDIEKALADRADWRADERRWCREGKLPRPGWWKEGMP